MVTLQSVQSHTGLTHHFYFFLTFGHSGAQRVNASWDILLQTFLVLLLTVVHVSGMLVFYAAAITFAKVVSFAW